MNVIDFAPPDERGEFFTGDPADGSKRFFHGTSCHFMHRISEHGFIVRYRLVSEEQLGVLSKYAEQMYNVGPTLVWSLGAGKRLGLTRSSTLALSYASGGLRGGIYKSLLDDLAVLLAPGAEKLPQQDITVLTRLKAELDGLAGSPGMVCAIDLQAAEIEQLDPRGQDPTYAPFDIAPDRIAAVMIVPAGYEHR